MFSYATIYSMENDPNNDQINFFNILDIDQATMATELAVSRPSSEELKLQELLDKKKVLDDKIFACVYCNKSSLGTCNHDFEMSELLRDIDEAEKNARGK